MALIRCLLLTSLLIAATSSTACPVSCNCSTTDLKVAVSCEGEEFTAIPRKLPANTTSLLLRDPVKCDCRFYQYWKTLKEKGIVIQGYCSDSSGDLNGISIDKLKEGSFSCDSINVLPSSSAISEKVSSHIGDGELRSSPAEMAPVTSQGASAVTSSQAVVVMAASPTSSEVTPSLSSLLSTSSEAPIVGRLHQVNSVVVSSHFKPLMRSSVSEHAPEGSSILSSSVEPTPADVSPTVSHITNASAAVTAPPTIKRPAVIVKFVEPKPVPLTKEVQIKCVATGNPPPKVSLIFNDQPAENVDGVTVTSSDSEAEIKFKAVMDSFIFCEATNELGRDIRKIRISVNQTGARYLLMKVKLIKEEFNENLNIRESKEFQDLSERIVSQVRSVLGSLSSFLGSSVASFRPGSVKADILIKTTADGGDSVQKTLQEEVNKAKLGDIPVDRYLYSFEQIQACPSVYENVTWNNAAHGTTDVQRCPRGLPGFARRNCSSGIWYYPDYTNCKTSDFLNLKNEINQSVSIENNKDKTEKDILTGLKDLLNLTTPNENYAILAGDLVTSTEILKLVVDYTTRASEDSVGTIEEVKNIVEVANNILHQHNEQEFIVAQKVLQTASKFILALEKYGLQSAQVASINAKKNLKIFITEYVVMGAGVAVPETISEDVIFPNYNWPDLARVKEEWNVTTFVVLSTQMIKDMKDMESYNGKDGIKIAAFLYRTLTRILSFESAYSDKGLNFEVNSAVISASTDPKPPTKLNDPVIIASSNLQEMADDDQPICAFWDFNLNAPHGGWSEEGCNTTNYNTMQTTCQCDHMTNFAVLRNKPLPPVASTGTRSTSDFMHCIYIACWIIIAFAGLTFLILLIVCCWLKPDRTWAMHMCVCASIIVSFVLVLFGLTSYNDLVLCNLYSFLAHYFYLCAFSWILTESIYMRIWDTIDGPKKKYWIGYFLLGWGLPGIPMVITWLIVKLTKFESFMSCWMSIFNPLMWVFFAPAVFLFLIACIVFLRVWRAITGLPRQGLKQYYYNTRFRVQIRYCIILMVMFIVTWLVGILLVQYYWKALLCILFIICCVITGFMILLFYVIMNRQVRDAIKSCCCYCRRGRRGNYWVRGEDVSRRQPEEEYRQQQRLQEREWLVSEGTEQQEKDPGMDVDGDDKSHEYEEPFLRQEARPVLMYEGTRPLDSSTESFDPLYDRVTKSSAVPVEVQPGPSTEEEKIKTEPVYAQVVKPKRLRHPESDSDDDDDELLTPEEREARGMRGLTREQVIRMAKKSDASKKVLRTYYESPKGSKEDLGGPVYLLNQAEMDEELSHFRSFFARDKTPLSSEPTTSTPKPDDASSTPGGTTFKRETSMQVHQSYQRMESTSSSISQRTFSAAESERTVTSVSYKEETKFEQTVVKEAVIDSSLQELEQRCDADDDSASKVTAVSHDDGNLRESLFKYFTSTHPKQEKGDDWCELLEALKE